MKILKRIKSNKYFLPLLCGSCVAIVCLCMVAILKTEISQHHAQNVEISRAERQSRKKPIKLETVKNVHHQKKSQNKK